MKSSDIAIIGLGTMGSFAALELARRRTSVVGLDQFIPPHERGSHSGETRVFRTAYIEHPNYTPLAQRSGLLWERFGEDVGIQLLTRSGLLSMGEPESELISGIQASAALHQLPIERLSPLEIRNQFPAFRPPESFIGLLERTAGWIDVDQSLTCAIDQARKLGAVLQVENPVLGWEQKGHQILIHCKRETISANKLIVAAGAWARKILHDLNVPLVVKRKVMAWLDPTLPEHFRPGSLPVFAFAPNFFYGFPNIGGRGVRVAEHLGGEIVHDVSVPVAPADERDLAPLFDTTSKFLPSLVGSSLAAMQQVLRAKTCLYTMTPDEHFIIDRHPLFENVFLAAGFSGHGFKFAPLIGKVLADLVLEGKTSLPVEFLRLNGRFE